MVNKILMKVFLSIIVFFFLFSATTICEDPFVSNFYHKDCLSNEHCLFSTSSNNSDKDSSGELPLPISHCHVGSSCVHNFTKLESPKPLIQTNHQTFTTLSGYSMPESYLIKSIFNPPRTVIS